jgi:putative membrane protein
MHLVGAGAASPPLHPFKAINYPYLAAWRGFGGLRPPQNMFFRRCQCGVAALAPAKAEDRGGNRSPHLLESALGQSENAMLPAPLAPSRWRQIRSVVLRWLIMTLAIFAAVWIVPGIEFAGYGWELGVVALVFGLVNIALRPILTLLTCPLVILTLGLFALVINAVLLLLTAQIAASLGLQFLVAGFWPAVLGGLVISIVNLILNALAGETPVRVVMRRE